MKIRKVWTLAAAIWLMWSVQAFAQQALTGLVNEGELREYVDLWSKAQETYYGNLYRKGFSITIERGASQFLVNRYAEAVVSQR